MKNYLFMILFFNLIWLSSCKQTEEGEKPNAKTALKLQEEAFHYHKKSEFCKAAYKSHYFLVNSMRKLTLQLNCKPGFSGKENFDHGNIIGCYLKKHRHYSKDKNLELRKSIAFDQKQKLTKHKKKVMAEFEQFLYESYICIGTTKPDKNLENHSPIGFQNDRYNEIMDLMGENYRYKRSENAIPQMLIIAEDNLKNHKSTKEVDAIIYGKLELLRHLMKNWDASTQLQIENWRYEKN